jgi:NAD+-dependent protein deacetylase sirtuin 4
MLKEESITNVIAPMAEALTRSKRLVVLTGAGISTESGIPDYRGSDGLWTRHTPIYYADFVRNPAVRRRYWARSLNGYRRFRDAQPNSGHLALAAMERAGRLHWLVTQNVDRLHTRAGSRRVIELHGENSTVQCIKCDYREPRSQTQARLEWDNRHLHLPADETGDAEDVVAPLCPQCGSLLKPTVVFFGETLPSDVVQRSFDAVAAGDALLVVGSSLTVWSGYRLVRAACDEDKPVYIINIGETRADNEATLKIEAPAGEALSSIASFFGIGEKPK